MLISDWSSDVCSSDLRLCWCYGPTVCSAKESRHEDVAWCSLIGALGNTELLSDRVADQTDRIVDGVGSGHPYWNIRTVRRIAQYSDWLYRTDRIWSFHVFCIRGVWLWPSYANGTLFRSRRPFCIVMSVDSHIADSRFGFPQDSSSSEEHTLELH